VNENRISHTTTSLAKNIKIAELAEARALMLPIFPGLKLVNKSSFQNRHLTDLLALSVSVPDLLPLTKMILLYIYSEKYASP
jgi:hypothetical protein